MGAIYGRYSGLNSGTSNLSIKRRDEECSVLLFKNAAIY